MRLHGFALAAGLVVMSGCATTGETDLASLASNSDQVIWEAGQKALERKDYEGARQHFRRIIDGFPQSEFGPSARLALADSYHREGGIANYILAAPAYRDFLTLYPSHPRSDYAQYMTAEVLWAQRNSPDRDQVPTRRALEEYVRLLELYPNTSYAEAARTRIAETRHNLARHEFLVGWFYQRTRKSCRSAIPRYQTVIETYPEYTGYDETLFRLGQCLLETGRGPEGLPHVARLLNEYPNSRFAAEARELHAALSAVAPAPAASPAPAPATGASPAPTPGSSSET